jgi:hypothetical protein
MSMSLTDRAVLLAALQPHVAALAEDQRVRLLHPTTPAEAAARDAAARLHADEGAGDPLDVWLDLLGRRAAVLWVLKHLYVRVLEDRKLITPRLIDPTHQLLFERLAPALGDTAFSRWVFTDLAQREGGLPELFAAQPAELLPPADALTRALLATLRATVGDAGARRFTFDDERFDGQLLGDLYQELDPVVKERFALLQTPDFVRAFILDRTLGEALQEWPADEVRVIDPACGSGHFLIDALRRLVDATAAQRPEWDRLRVVQHALNRVVGLDLNDYAAALARARLVMTALELSGRGSLRAAAAFHPHVYWADGLEQIERDEEDQASQLGLPWAAEEATRSVLTPSETRKALRPVLKPGFQVVVANPPYITEKDEARKKYHKAQIGKPKRARYQSAFRKYNLGATFTERCFQLALPAGFVGIINSNAFAKREFGVPLVEDVLAHEDLTLLVDTSGAFIPGHGTPTLLLFARKRPPSGPTFTAVLGKRGEPSNPADPARGKVWSAILAGWATAGFDSPFVSTEFVSREVFAKHPWSLRGGGALGLQRLVETGSQTLGSAWDSSGFGAIMGEDDAFLRPTGRGGRLYEPDSVRPLVEGDVVRDWGLIPASVAIFPYNDYFGTLPIEQIPSGLSRLAVVLGARVEFGGKTYLESGRHWSEYHQYSVNRLRKELGIGFAFVATHNHFVLDRGGKVFNRSAPLIKLPADATEDDHLALLGPLNSSTACFWMKQAFFCKGRGGYGGGIKVEDWDEWYEFDSTKLARFPLPPHRTATLPWARALDALGHARAADTVAAALAEPSWSNPAALRELLGARRARDLGRLRAMVAHQEELDWLVYRLYGLVPAALPVLDPDATPPLTPGHRPFELDLEVTDAEARAAASRGETPETAETKWFVIHGWPPATDLPADLPPSYADLVHRRRALTAATPHLQLLEAPVHKRRWYRPDHADQERLGLRTWLLDRLEQALQPARQPTTPRALARELAADERFVAAAVVYTAVEAPDLGALCAALMASDAVAAHPVHRYTAKGLVKRRAWEKTWALQAAEDRGEKVGKIPVPPSYTGADFIGTVAYPLRGKLDVPKERFVAHTEVPRADGTRRTGEEALYAWAGWTRAERISRLFALLETLDDEGVPANQRVALHDLLFRYTDELARTEPANAADLRADLRGETGGAPTEAQVQGWLKEHPAGGRG